VQKEFTEWHRKKLKTSEKMVINKVMTLT
jgi:hypothetical protein